jgi:hypothetical protein
LQLIRVRIAPIYWLKKSGCVLPVRHEHLGSVVVGVILEIDDGVTVVIPKKPVFKPYRVIGVLAGRAQY